MLDVLPERFLGLAKRAMQPTVVQTFRATAAATLSYVVALWLTEAQAPLLAPLTALLVVQVTFYATLQMGIRRVNSVVAGVLIALGFSAVVGLSWWSLGLLILSALAVGHIVRVHEFVNEVAISAMLVLGVAQVTALAKDRVVETLIGAVVGSLFNVVFVPPLWVRSAGESIADLATRMRRLLLHLGEEPGVPTPVELAAIKLHEARQLDQDISEVDASIRQAEDSLRLNPRVREGLLSRIVLRTGLDTLEICAVLLRTTSRTLTDLAEKRQDEPLFPPEEAEALQELFAHLAAAVESFATLITTQVSANAEEAEDRLVRELDASHASRDRIAHLLLDGVREHPRQWQLHGSLLADIDRMLSELDVQRRSMRLADELDRYARERHERYPRLTKLARRMPRLPRLAGLRRRRRSR